MSTELDAFLAAIAADPADDVRRLALADWLDDQDAVPDRWRATAEFVRLTCNMRGGAITAKAGEWLGMNWTRLVPAFGAWCRELLSRRTRGPFTAPWGRIRREGRTLVFERRSFYTAHGRFGPTELGPYSERVDLEFSRGFVRRCVFRDWQFMDAVLPLLVGDQPFVEPELTNFARVEEEWEAVENPYAIHPKPHPKGGVSLLARVYRSRIGPAFDALRFFRDDGTEYEAFPANGAFRLRPGPNNDAEARVRAALVLVFTERARGIAAGTVAPGVDVAANAEAVAAQQG